MYYKLSSYIHSSRNLPRSKQQRHPPGFAMDIQNVPLTVRTVRTLSYVVAAPGNATSQAQQAVGEFVQMSCLDSKNHNSSSVQNNSTTCRNIEEEDSEDSPEPLSPRVRRSALRRTLAAGDECPKTGDWKGQC